MAGYLAGALTGTAGGLAGSAVSSVIQRIFVNPRSIGRFTADVTIEERHEDSLVVTQHPVETGSVATDHAYKQPAKVTIRCGWSNASLKALLGMAESLLDGSLSFDADYVQTTYRKFLDLQSSRDLFDVVTGKRSYKNMLITHLNVVTDKTSEYALMMTCECQEILLATTQTVQANQTQNGGTKSLQDAPKYNPTATP